MRVLIVAVGRLKQGPERELAERYRKRATDFGRKIGMQTFDIVEIRESRADNLERRMLEESIAIANVIPDRAITVILDERGSTMNSASFAGRLQDWRAQDRPALVFILGGADGLAPSANAKSALSRRLGALTWPHQLVRILLLEQLYRAVTILGGHPYHRA
jgi:23S rRNA (pseudouridine1915-N3)-methyltransferase